MFIRRHVPHCLPLLWLTLAATTAATALAGDSESPPVFRELRKFVSPNAHQAAAVDRERFYAIGSRAITSYDKQTGELLAEFAASDELPLEYLNSGVVIDGKL